MSDITLSPEQQKIVDLESGQHLVLAPPGTGKTELLVHRIEKAINNFPQDEIACLTFTNRAAKNMVDRIKREIGENDVFIGNIHSFCSKFLRKNNLIPQITSMLDEEDARLLFEEINFDITQEEKELSQRSSPNPGNLKPEELAKYNSYLKQKSMGFEAKICQVNPFNDFREMKGQKICSRYEEIKRESNLIDFDDLLNLTYDHFNKKSQLKPNIQWLQVDEAQDLNPLQWAIIDKISSKDFSHRVFFGDSEQAIFSFMGASIENLEQIGRESKTHSLATNYRSPQYLLDLYNQFAKKKLEVNWSHTPVAAKNTPYSSGNLQIFSNVGSQEIATSTIILPRIVSGFTSKKLDKLTNKELIEVALNEKFINEFIDLDNAVNSENIIENIRAKLIDNSAILVRTNKNTQPFYEMLKSQSPELTVFVIAQFDLFHRMIVKDLMSILSIIVNDRDKVAWTRIFSIFGGTTLKAARPLIDTSFKSGINPLDFIESSDYEVDYLNNFLDIFNNQRVVVFDTETTGLNIDREDDIIEIAAIEIIKGQIGESFVVNIDTDLDFTEAEKIHHISKEYLKEHAIDRSLALSNFVEFIGNDTIIAHNLDFDYTILNQNLQKSGIPNLSVTIKTYDSVEMTKRLFPNLPRYKLGYLLDYFDLEGVNSHRAIDDVKATLSLINFCVDKINSTHKERSNWENNPETLRIVQRFIDRFSILYSALKSDFNNEIKMSDITNSITSYINDHVNRSRYNEAAFIELDKLKTYMDKTLILEKSIDSIQNNVPNLTKSKESDMIVAGETDVVISTIHKAKGLEWNNVIVPNCVASVFPHFYSKKESQQLEDARLLYVAMTRAKKSLVLLEPRLINGFKARPSPFTYGIRAMFEEYEL
jgi:DNA helicase II / ATP-dependent DNA helicase PcrA